MKLVIQTQVRENYGDANKPYWKFKGGDTYVVPNLTAPQAAKVVEQGIPTLTNLIESRNPMFEEYILGFNVVEDDAVVCEPWETPFELFWEQNRWVARRTVRNDNEYGYMRRGIAAKIEQYTMHMGGERANYSVVYELQDGRVMGNDAACKALEELEAA